MIRVILDGSDMTIDEKFSISAKEQLDKRFEYTRDTYAVEYVQVSSRVNLQFPILI